MLNISSKTKSHILVLIFGPHVPLWLPSIVTLHIYIISGPFWSKFTEIYDFLCSHGVALPLKERVFLNAVPFLSKFIRYDLGGCKGAALNCLRKFCILQTKYA